MSNGVRETADRTTTAIQKLDGRLVSALVTRYLAQPDDSGSGFAGMTFDELGDAGGPGFTADDLVAASLLDVRVKPTATRALLVERREDFAQLLDAVPADVDLWESSDDALDAATEVWEQLRNLPGIDWVIAGKLLARKRPRLIPVYDSVVQRELGLAAGDPVWRGLRHALSAEGLRRRIEGWRPSGDRFAAVSTLRLLDIALWMHGSQSRAARDARDELGTNGVAIT